MRNLSRGIERAVKDEYTKETVQRNREDESFELKAVFGVESELRDNPKFREVIKINHLRTLRLEYLKKVLQGIFVRPFKGNAGREGQEQMARPGDNAKVRLLVNLLRGLKTGWT